MAMLVHQRPLTAAPPLPPTFIGATNAHTNTASANITCNYHASSAANDLMLLFAGFQRVPTSGTQTIATPANWNLLDMQYVGVGMVAGVYWRYRGAETSVTATASNASSEYGCAVVHAYRGASGNPNPIDPINVMDLAFDSKVNLSSARVMPNITTTVDNCPLVFWFFADKVSSGTATWSAPATERIDAYSGTTGRMLYGSADSDVPKSPAGPIGTGFTWTPNGSTSESAIASVAIEPW